MINESQYKSWQHQYETNRWFRWFWEFWAIHAVLIFIFLSVRLLMYHEGREALAFGLLALLISRYVVCNIIYAFYKKQRPYQVYHFREQASSALFSWQSPKQNSFPSRHVTNLTAVATVLFLFFPYWGAVLFVLIGMIALGRVVLGFHFPIDSIAGVFIGLGVGYVIFYWLGPLLFMYLLPLNFLLK